MFKKAKEFVKTHKNEILMVAVGCVLFKQRSTIATLSAENSVYKTIINAACEAVKR